MMNKNGKLYAKKSLGQNFLVNPRIAERIAQNSVTEGCCGALEIGAGRGILTIALASCFEKVVAVEIDGDLIPELQANLALKNVKNVTVVQGDILKLDLHKLLETEFKGMNVVCVGNLPYYITSPIVTKLLESRLAVRSIVVMVQKEVAVRLCAPFKTPNISAISFCIRYHSVPQLLFLVSNGNFRPIPKVDSAVVKFRILETPAVRISNPALMFSLIKTGFSQRRKTLVNSLGKQLGLNKANLEMILAEFGIQAQARAEELSLADFAAITAACYQSGLTLQH
ncbi:MAG: 16S rRNA (adenine(1518)-N(6)/adenine(1519)-N(6))-dimethyltransferase RsmA [Oscillospiraceae bacterium]|jgi:16S rRNA (adenine1518-N6/adenine1519-N6)-dimethyltransferase|nr:16S rRNA (adenine(1518)-N(6)/adenine(1519)-N(6))-dimethyltransferase RsmA [Oscillospiraceae bacterium]